jgi:predicted branched-subunit amino acid permease
MSSFISYPVWITFIAGGAALGDAHPYTATEGLAPDVLAGTTAYFGTVLLSSYLARKAFGRNAVVGLAAAALSISHVAPFFSDVAKQVTSDIQHRYTQHNSSASVRPASRPAHIHQITAHS